MKSYTNTPLFEARMPLDIPVWFKMDCYQPTGSFKIRGMDELVAHHIKEGRTRFIASSGGNAGFSLAYAARLRGGAVRVVVPKTTNQRMRDLISNQGAEVRVHGDAWDDADQLAREMAEKEKAIYVSPFDDPLLWKGHSTIIDEIVYDYKMLGHPFPKKLVVAVGGGGLYCGIMHGLQRHDLLESVTIYAAETEGAASFRETLHAGKLTSISEVKTIASSLGAKMVAEEAWRWQWLVGSTQSLTCTDLEAVEACRKFAEHYQVLVEPACGAALSAVMHKAQFNEEALVIVCGGIGWTVKDQEKFLQKYQDPKATY